MSARTERLVPLIDRELVVAAAAEAHGDVAGAWIALERAHIAAQPMAVIHTRVHARMIQLAWRERDLFELLGQIAVLPFAPIASLTGIYRVAGGRFHRSGLAVAGVPDDILAAIAHASSRIREPHTGAREAPRDL